MRTTAQLAAALVVAVLAVGTAGAALTLGNQASTGEAVSAQEAPQPQQASETQTIAVTGNGEATASPDRAVVRVAAVAEGDDPAAVRDDLAQGAADLRAALEAAGVDEDRITTADYTIRETRPHPRHREGERDGPQYRGVHAFEVELDDTDRAGDVVDAAADSGAQVQRVEFTLAEETREQLRDEALQNAMDDAEHQAGTLADSGELEVTGVRSIDATDGRFRPVRLGGDAAVAEAAGPAPDTSIDAGDVSVEVTVQVVYGAAG